MKVVQAHQSVRDAALGMFDDHLTSFKISEMQVCFPGLPAGFAILNLQHCLRWDERD